MGVDSRFAPFARDDCLYGDMGKGPLSMTDKVRLYSLGVILVPLRLLLSIGLLLIFWFNLKVAHWCPPWQKCGGAIAVGRGLTRVCLAVLGFVWIKRHRIGPSAERKADDKYPVLIASNHVSWVDIVLHFYLYFPASFIIKASVWKIPIIGDIGKHIKCIGVVRENKDSADKGVSDIITARLQDEYAKETPADRHPVLLFPEGTTTNGKYLLPFKTGAFIAGVPVKPIVLKYKTRRMSPSWESMNGVRHVMLMMAHPFHSAAVYELPTYYPSQAEKEDAKLYAANVCEYMRLQCLLEATTSSLQDKRDYHLLLKSKQKKE